MSLDNEGQPDELQAMTARLRDDARAYLAAIEAKQAADRGLGEKESSLRATLQAIYNTEMPIGLPLIVDGILIDWSSDRLKLTKVITNFDAPGTLPEGCVA